MVNNKNGWTKEEINNARNVNLEDYFRSKGYTLELKNHRYYVKEIAGLVLKNCTYYDFYGSNANHNTAIDCLMNILGYSFNEAMESLTGKHIVKVSREGVVYNSSKTPDMNEKKQLRMPEKYNGQYKRIYAYLIKRRRMSSKLVTYLVKNGLLYQDKKGNCVFVWKNGEEVVGADINGTTDYRFKGIAPGSDQNVGFNFCLSSHVEKIMFFESPIELMSYLMIKKKILNKKTKYVSLSGCKDIVINFHVQLHPDAEVVISTNNDKAGKSLADKYNYKTEIPKNHNDWNDVLIEMNVIG